MISELMIEQMWNDYDSPVVSTQEFEQDVMRVVFISRLLKKYKKNEATNVRFLINHIVILNNMFPQTWAQALLENIDDDMIPYLYACLIAMNRIRPNNPHHEGFLVYINRELNNELRRTKK